MEEPETIAEIHREELEQVTVEAYGRNRHFVVHNDGTLADSTASADVAVGRIWFSVDRRQRLWQEEVNGSVRDPSHHYAIDLELAPHSRVKINETSCGFKLSASGPEMMKTPDGFPREAGDIWLECNEIPLLGRFTIHDHVQSWETGPGKQTIGLDFSDQAAPELVVALPSNEEGPVLLGRFVVVRPDGLTVVSGRDPRITWDLDYVDWYGITHCSAFRQFVDFLHRRLAMSVDKARKRILDEIVMNATKTVTAQLRALSGTGRLPIMREGIDVGTARDGGRAAMTLGAVAHRFEKDGVTDELLLVQRHISHGGTRQ